MMRLACSLVFLGVAACAPANSNDPDFWTPSVGLTNPGTTAEDAAINDAIPQDGALSSDGPSNKCSLHVDFMTHSYGGRYAPNNVGAVWVTDSSGKFVKTLALWGRRRSYNLYWWHKASNDNTVDVVTGATLRSHTTHAVDWNCENVAHKRVPPGTYKVFAEFTESNTSGPSITGPKFNVPIQIGTIPVTETPDDDKAFTKKRFVFAP